MESSHTAEVVNTLFKDISNSQKGATLSEPSGVKHFSISDEHLLSLSFFFGKNLERALQIAASGNVRVVIAEPSGRTIFQVAGHGGEKYSCFPGCYCSCQSFFFDVVSKGEQINCKHQLAARLADVLQSASCEKVSDAALARIMMQV